MSTNEEPGFQFRPSCVEGLPDVRLVTVFPDRLEFVSSGQAVVLDLLDVAGFPRPRWIWRFLARLGCRRRWLNVGERDWFHPPPDRFIRYYSTPPVVVYMPDETGVSYPATVFRRVQEVMMQGGFGTTDLG